MNIEILERGLLGNNEKSEKMVAAEARVAAGKRKFEEINAEFEQAEKASQTK